MQAATNLPEMGNVDLTEFLVAENQRLLAQAKRVVARLPAAVYAASIREAGGQRIGSQMRHILEFYSVFLDGCERAEVDYDARPRERAIETDPLVAVRRIDELNHSFDQIRRLPAGFLLRVRAEDANPGTDDGWLLSSAGREMQFLRSHAIHHFALIALLLRAIGVAVEDGLGVAPSTLRYQAAEAA